MKKALLRLLCAVRSFFGFCPECNSDAPRVYSCDVCTGHRKYYPTWWVKEGRRQRFYKKHNL